MKKSLLQTINANKHIAFLIAMLLIVLGVVFYKYATVMADLPFMMRMRLQREDSERPAAPPASPAPTPVIEIPPPVSPETQEMRRRRQQSEEMDAAAPAPASPAPGDSASSPSNICGKFCGNGGFFDCSNGTPWCNENAAYCQQRCAGAPLNEDGENGCMRQCATERNTQNH